MFLSVLKKLTCNVASLFLYRYGEVLPVTIEEKWFAICSMLMGIVVFFGVILGGMASQLTNLDTERAQYSHRLNVIKKHLVGVTIYLLAYTALGSFLLLMG